MPAYEEPQAMPGGIYLHEFFLRNHLKSPEDFHPLPKKEERNAWDAVPQAVKDHYIRRAEEILETVTPPLLASEYMAFYKDGSRTHYEEPFHDSRVNLRLQGMTAGKDGYIRSGGANRMRRTGLKAPDTI